MKEIIKKWFDILEYPKEYECLLFSSFGIFDKAAIEKNEKPYTWLQEQDDKNLCLLYALCKCEDFFNKHVSLGMPENIIIDTMREVKRHTRKYSENGSDKLGIFNIKWVGTVLSGNLFCLGRLEFQMKKATVEIEKHGIKLGDNIVNVHIPGTKTPLDKTDVDFSFDSAYEFFERFFPEFDYKGFTCYSWLMDPTLKKLLPKTSNIVGFLDRFDIVSSKESDSALKHVFDRNATYENIMQYTPKTSLQKAIAEYVQNGGKMLMALGYKQK